MGGPIWRRKAIFDLPCCLRGNVGKLPYPFNGDHSILYKATDPSCPKEYSIEGETIGKG